MPQATDVIKKPLITEKSYWEAQRHNRYTFLVDRTATKDQIRAAVIDLYKVRVKNVRTQVRKGKAFRHKHGSSTTGDWKRAVVIIHPEDKIESY